MKKIFSSFLFLFLILSNAAADNLDKLYLVGPGPKDCSWSNRVEMNKLSDGSFEFTNQFSATGEDGFKFAKETSGWDCIHPSQWVTLNRNAEYTLTDNDEPDDKIKVETSGWYTIHVSADGTKMSTYPVYIYPVGDGCDAGWTRGNVTFTETEFGSGKYKGTLELKTDVGHGLKFMYDKGDEYWNLHVGPAVDESGKHDITGTGTFDTKFYTSGDHQFYVLDEGKGTYNMTVDMKNEKLYLVPNTSITVTAAISDSAKKMLTKDDKSIQLFWWNDIESGIITMTESEGKWSAQVSDYHMPIKFLIYNGKFKDQGGVQTVDMANDGAGYTDDICVMVLSKKADKEDKLICYHNTDCNVFKSIKVSAQITPAAKDRIGDKVYLHSWATDGGTDPVDIEMAPVQGKENWFEATVEVIGGLNFIIGNQDYSVKIDDMTNDGAGFTNNVNVDIRYAQTGRLPAEINTTGADFTPYNVTLKANVTKEALSDMGNEVNCHAWIAGSSIAYDKNELTQTDGFYTCTISTLDPICFCYHGGDDWTHTTVDMTNDGAGYTADKCVNIISRTTNVGGNDKMWCFHNDQCTIASATTTVNAYVDAGADWEQVRFFSEGVGEQSQYYNWFTPELTKGEDGWYNYEYVGESSLTIAAASDVNWTKRIDNIENVSGTKYYYISSETKGGDGADKYYNKVIELNEKKTPITFTFRFSDVAKQTWEDKDVYLRYWMNYQDLGEDAARDHVFFKQLTADDNGIYSCTIFPIAPIKLTIQSCGEGYHGESCQDGHWTNDLSDGYTTNKDFIIKDYNAGGHLLEEYSEDQLNIHFTSDGYATACWDRTWTIEGVDVYMGEYDATEEALYLNIVNDGIVPANAGVVLYSTSKADQVVPLVATDNAPQDYDAEQNDLLGTTVSTALPQTGTTFVLGKMSDSSTMLYKYNGETIPANKAYLNIPGSGAPARVRMITRTTPTALTTIQNKDTAQKIMRNNQIYILKNGEVYSIIGQIVK